VIYQPQADQEYYGRGPLQLKYPYNYGRFSNVFIENQYNSKMVYVNDPDQVADDGYTAWAAAIWFYMTP
jgi:hypothetical protein